MNERITENIVRDFLKEKGYYADNNIVIEEQQSKNPRLQKLLGTASKKGKGRGYPEFIIWSKEYSDFIVIVECKADPGKHISPQMDKFSEYAVDGAILYASYLSKEFDVLAIGVSGETRQELKISHYLNLKNGKTYEKIFGDTFLSFPDYHVGYTQHPQKFNQAYEKLLDYSKEINEILHAKKIKESQRSLLISGILMALQNKAFVSSFKNYKTAKQLTKYLVETIIDELSSENLSEGKIFNLKQAFSFILTHATLSTDKEFLQELIIDIDSNINSFIRTYRYFDTIGQFYIEFLRYANNDKGLGIILTPPHITELFAELADVNKDSRIIDNCCGTGGFLISAMKLMIQYAKGDSDKITNIKKRQLVGIEFQDDIYALAISNMIIHGDGKSNIHQGDCFSLTEIITNQYHPNVGFLNPPYKTKKSDIEELEFVLNNLDMLEQHGKCVAIIPMSCVLAQSGIGLELKRKLLLKHTLEAVMSMPSELFHNSKVGVITSVLVITAHLPHPPGKKTWFGYWRDDGFVKVKGKGRIDANNRWKENKQTWVSAYKNKEVIPSLSVMHEIVAEDEWCAEAFLETNYDHIDSSLFEQELKKYAAYQILNA